MLPVVGYSASTREIVIFASQRYDVPEGYLYSSTRLLADDEDAETIDIFWRLLLPICLRQNVAETCDFASQS
jgi:hypothetical protein